MAGLFDKMKARFSKKEKNRQNEVQTLQASPDTGGMEEKPGTLLVVGNESSFSDEVTAYALDMAERLSYRILALNTAPLSCETFQQFSSSRKKICDDFMSMSELNGRKFAEMASAKNITFEHVVKFSEVDQAIEEIRHEKGQIDFVISEPEEALTKVRPEQGSRVQREICVYSMI